MNPMGSQIELLEAYARTIWTGSSPAGPSFRIRVGDSKRVDEILDDIGADMAAIVTAWNPQSRILPPDENERRDAALLADLRSKRLRPRRCVGTSPDGNWSEQSWLVATAGMETAVHLGREWEQNAIMWMERGQPARLLVTRDGFAGFPAGHVVDPDDRPASAFRESREGESQCT